MADDQPTQEQKPNVAGGSSDTHLNLKVKAQDGNVVFFKAKPSTPFRKLMTAYCQKSSIDPESVVFSFDGQRLRGEQTPADVEMEDQDEIQVMIHQVGG